MSLCSDQWVAAVLGTDIDANGNVSFTTTNMIPIGQPITGQVLIAGGSSAPQPLVVGRRRSPCPVPPSRR